MPTFIDESERRLRGSNPARLEVYSCIKCWKLQLDRIVFEGDGAECASLTVPHKTTQSEKDRDRQGTEEPRRPPPFLAGVLARHGLSLDELLGRMVVPGDRVTWIYFVQSENGGPIKIGQSSSLRGRIETLRSFSPVPLVVLAAVRRCHTVERVLHAYFAKHRLHGEWFAPAPELLKLIREWGGSDPMGVDDRDLKPDKWDLAAAFARVTRRGAVALVALALLGGCRHDDDLLLDEQASFPDGWPHAAQMRCRPGWVPVVTDMPGPAVDVRCVKRSTVGSP